MCLLLTIARFANSQNSEIGVSFGGLKYYGDLSREVNAKLIMPGGGGFYRRNISNVLSYKLKFVAGTLKGSDKITPIDMFSNKRNKDFKISILEFSTTFEYHFLKWRMENSPIRWTPYLYGGIGILGISQIQKKSVEYSKLQPILPFGVGFKYVLNPKMYVGASIGFRKTFFDYLDNVSGGDGVFKNYDYANQYNNDHYVYLEFSINYAFYRIACPFVPYKKFGK